MSLGDNIRYLRKRSGMSQEALAEKLGYRSFTTIQKWESGVSTPPIEVFARMAEIFEVDLDDFARIDLESADQQKEAALRAVSVPVYGRIPAGIPLEAIEDITGHAALSSGLADTGKEYFALRIEGSSMYPKYEDGDIVIFERMSVCENGDDCAVRISGSDATFKKIRILENSIILQPINPEYDPIQINVNDGGPQPEILGVAREIRRKV